MKALTVFRDYFDWILFLSITVAACILLFVFLFAPQYENATYKDNRKKSFKYEPASAYQIVPPDPNFPPPAEEQLPLNEIINIDNVSIDLFWANRNVDRLESIGSHSFTLNVRNHKNAVQVVPPETLRKISVGCIATETPYTVHSVLPITDLILQPYEKKEISFAVSVNCLYVGTADGKYFWRIY